MCLRHALSDADVLDAVRQRIICAGGIESVNAHGFAMDARSARHAIHSAGGFGNSGRTGVDADRLPANAISKEVNHAGATRRISC